MSTMREEMRHRRRQGSAGIDALIEWRTCCGRRARRGEAVEAVLAACWYRVVTLRALARGGHREAYGPGEVEGDEAAEEQEREVLRNIWGGVA
jgi:hypothetical protein